MKCYRLSFKNKGEGEGRGGEGLIGDYGTDSQLKASLASSVYKFNWIKRKKGGRGFIQRGRKGA